MSTGPFRLAGTSDFDVDNVFRRLQCEMLAAKSSYEKTKGFCRKRENSSCLLLAFMRRQKKTATLFPLSNVIFKRKEEQKQEQNTFFRSLEF